MPNILKRQRILCDIDSFVADFSMKNPGRLIVCHVDWLADEITMFYRSCCGGSPKKCHYQQAEDKLKKIHEFKQVHWMHRR
jgi:hypothetical protein